VTQLILDLPHRPASGREDFLIAPSNQVAMAWIDRWPDWPAPGLAIHGPSGCGKTHLAQVWLGAAGARRLGIEDLMTRAAAEHLRQGRALALDGIDAELSATPGAEERLLHLYNQLVEAGGHLLLTAERPPAHWPIGLPDLRSRLAAIPAVALGAPDDRLMLALLAKLFADRQLHVDAEVLEYCLRRMERSFAAACSLVAAADRVSLTARREITVPLMRDILSQSAIEKSRED